MNTYASTFAGIRALVVDSGAVGRAVYRDEAADDAKTPYVTIADASTVSTSLAGDSAPLGVARSLEVVLVQRNARDSDPNLAPTIARAVHMARFEVAQERVTVRCGPVENEPAEGYFVQRMIVTAYQPPYLP